MTTLTSKRNKQPFIDLTLEEAAVVEGGKGRVYLSYIEALKLTRDERDKRDEPYLRVDGRKIWEARGGMKVGDICKIGKSASLRSKIVLWEKDAGSDDFIGRLKINPFGNFRPIPGKPIMETLTGSGAKYRLYYSV